MRAQSSIESPRSLSRAVPVSLCLVAAERAGGDKARTREGETVSEGGQAECCSNTAVLSLLDRSFPSSCVRLLSNTRSLEQYLTELTETKDNEIKDALAEAKVHQQALSRAEAHATTIEEMYKAQVHKLTVTLEKLTGQGSQPVSKAEMDASFAAVLRDEMRTMSAAFTAKLAKVTADAQARQTESAKLIRQLQEQILEAKRNNNSLVDKIARGPASASPTAADAVSPPGTGPIFAATAAARAQSGATGAAAAVASKPAPASASSSAASALLASKPAAASSTSAPNGSLSSRTPAPTSAASSVPAGAKPVVKSSALKTK